MRKSLLILACAFLLQGQINAARAEFIGNAFGGQAEEATRAAAARAFEGYQSFYAGMSQLERRTSGSAREAFQVASNRFQDSRNEYQRAAPLLRGQPFDLSRLEPPQAQLLLQFLGPFGANPTSDQAGILQAYAESFAQTAALVRDGAQEMTLPRFRQLQMTINRQILVGTFISRALGRS
jgi:hypothetical protein